ALREFLRRFGRRVGEVDDERARLRECRRREKQQRECECDPLHGSLLFIRCSHSRTCDSRAPPAATYSSYSRSASAGFWFSVTIARFSVAAFTRARRAASNSRAAASSEPRCCRATPRLLWAFAVSCGESPAAIAFERSSRASSSSPFARRVVPRR